MQYTVATVFGDCYCACELLSIFPLTSLTLPLSWLMIYQGILQLRAALSYGLKNATNFEYRSVSLSQEVSAHIKITKTNIPFKVFGILLLQAYYQRALFKSIRYLVQGFSQGLCVMLCPLLSMLPRQLQPVYTENAMLPCQSCIPSYPPYHTYLVRRQKVA